MKSSWQERLDEQARHIATQAEQIKTLAKAVLDLESRLGRMEEASQSDEPPESTRYLDGTPK